MFVIPALDILDGKCVRLRQGDYRQVSVYADSPCAQAQLFRAQGALMLHVVDLDGARTGMQRNATIVQDIAREIPLPIQVGGGVRSVEQAAALLQCGIYRVILGTAALEQPEMLTKLVNRFGCERIAVSLDSLNGRLRISGWEKDAEITTEDAVTCLKDAGISVVIVTDISRDGMLGEPNFELIGRYVQQGFQVIASGGVCTREQIRELQSIGVYGAIVGKAVYEGRLDFVAVQREVLSLPTFAKRIIPCLDIKDGRVVKGTHFTDLVDSGDPVELGSRYAEEGADELVCLDIAASVEERGNRVELVRRLAAHVPIPLTVGGGIRSLEDISALLQAGADKVSIGTQAVTNPQLVREASLRFGAQAIVISVDARRSGDNWFIYVKGGSEKTEVRVLDFVKHMQDLGAGELLVNSLDRDGTQVGFDLALLISITDSVSIPVIASSGAGTLDHFLQAFRQARVDAVLAARVFHSRLLEIPVVKAYVSAQGIKIRD